MPTYRHNCALKGLTPNNRFPKSNSGKVSVSTTSVQSLAEGLTQSFVLPKTSIAKSSQSKFIRNRNSKTVTGKEISNVKFKSCTKSAIPTY